MHGIDMSHGSSPLSTRLHLAVDGVLQTLSCVFATIGHIDIQARGIKACLTVMVLSYKDV